ncbi:hypothetical protein H634G_09933 [Metarhizium anisopliae BRIP 53293]|uniref:AB hydrolase-1 domain-containing protein n=1 Tax=Metarhizium anisopliae BRIP 53293 TaxID=1291518 RepID=A0A0D9NLQ7_METAN|nr:hypothetical protein H634G_09933 [Metarhizium anisopliae BRIP 53293]KJK94815.1 hypothetical protein H633G_01325 [Metarhizium anisopliae BRIP 53284]
MDKPALLFIGGGWHTPDSYSKLINALETAGHQVHCPRLPSMNQERPPTASLADDSEHIRACAEQLIKDGSRIIAIMHSYGGQVGTNCLHGLGVKTLSAMGRNGGVSHLVYLCAFALPEGGSMAGKAREMGHEALMPIAFDFADDMTVLCRDPKTQLVGEDADEKESENYLPSLVRWNGQAMYDSISHCAWREIPVTYVYTTNDATVPLDYQKSMVALLEEQGQTVKTRELQTGHCPNLTATDGVVAIINEVVKGEA